MRRTPGGQVELYDGMHRKDALEAVAKELKLETVDVHVWPAAASQRLMKTICTIINATNTTRMSALDKDPGKRFLDLVTGLANSLKGSVPGKPYLEVVKVIVAALELALGQDEDEQLLGPVTRDSACKLVRIARASPLPSLTPCLADLRSHHGRGGARSLRDLQHADVCGWRVQRRLLAARGGREQAAVCGCDAGHAAEGTQA